MSGLERTETGQMFWIYDEFNCGRGKNVIANAKSENFVVIFNGNSKSVEYW